MSEDLFGSSIVIPDDFIKNLGSADEKLKTLASTAEDTAKKVANAFVGMTSGVDTFITAIQKAIDELSKIGEGGNINIFSNINSDANETSELVTKISNEINRIGKEKIELVNLSDENKVIEMINEVKKAKNDLLKTNREIANQNAQNLNDELARSNEIAQQKRELLRQDKENANAELALSNELAQQKRELARQDKERANQEKINTANSKKNTAEQVTLIQQQVLAQKEKQRIDTEIARVNNMSESSEEAVIKKRAALINLTDRLSSSNGKYASEVSNLTESYNRLSGVLAKFEATATELKKIKLGRVEETAEIKAYTKAMGASEGSLVQRLNKITLLKSALDKLKNSTRDYAIEEGKLEKEIERVNKLIKTTVSDTNNLERSHSSLLNTSQQLMRQLALVFSVSQIQGYINKLIEVRGEFEMQQRALQAILQDTDEANHLFAQITELAVKSPFRVKELVSYTKQMAAYRVETDKLYDTTKRLADISSGLGVDMQRLILAYGQVKAANFLRGTELRQFSEAGINILGELSTYFSELKGQAISVGDVFEMVSKRMVSFEDVAEVFKRMTDAGGVFYNMQEVQAETLQGQMSNMKDQIDLMLNDVGKSSDSILKNSIIGMKSIISNWRTLAAIMKSVLVGLGTYKILVTAVATKEQFVNKLMVVRLAFASKETKQRMLQATLNKIDLLKEQGKTKELEKQLALHKAIERAMNTHPYLLIASIVATIGAGIYEWYQNAKRVSRELEDIGNRGVGDAIVSANKFKALAATATDSTKTYAEQKAALDELRRTYGDIIPQEQLNIESLKELKGNYDSVTAAIYAKIEAKTKEHQLEKVQEEYGKDVDDSMDAMTKMLRKYNISVDDARVILTKFREELTKSYVETPQKAQTILENLIKEYTNLDNISLTQLGFYREGNQNVFGRVISSQVTDLYEAINKLNYQRKLIIESVNSGFVKGGGSAAYKTIMSELDNISQSVSKWKKDHEGEMNPFELDEKAKSIAIAKYEDFIKKTQDKLSGLATTDKNYSIFVKGIEKAQQAINSLNGTKAQQEIQKIVVEAYKMNNVSFDDLHRKLLGSEETIEEYAKRIKDEIASIEQSIALYNKIEKATPWNEEEIDALNNKLLALKWVLQFVNIEEVKATKNATDINKIRLDTLKQANSEYEKLIKYYDKETAKIKTKNLMMSAFKQAGLSSSFTDSLDFTAKGTIDSMNKMLSMYGSSMKKETRTSIEKALADLKTQVEIEAVVSKQEEFKNSIDKLFDNYQLSLDVEALGLDQDTISQLFDVDIFDLPTLRSKLTEMRDTAEKLGLDSVKVYKDALKKLDDVELKHTQDQLKTYVKFLNRSVLERVKIEMDAQKQIADVRSNTKFSETQKNAIADNIMKDAQRKIDASKWQEFQNSELYIKMFENLEMASTKSLKVMQDRLSELRGSLKSLEPHQLRTIQSQYDKITEALTKRNPFSELSKSIKGYRKYLQESKRLNETFAKKQEEITKLTDNREYTEKALNNLREELKVSEKKYGVNSKEANAIRAKIKQNEANLDVILKELVVQGKISQELANQIRNGEQLKKTTGDALSDIGTWANELSSAINDVASSLENVFGTMDDKTKDTVESMSEIANGLGDTAGGLGRAFSGDVVGGVIQTVSGIAKTIGSIAAIGDKKKEREIKRQIANVEKLQNAYGKLEKAINDAYSTDTLKASQAQTEENLKAQIASYEKMIQQEQSKKKKDKKRIEEWQQAIDDAYQQLEELKESFVESLGGFGSEANFKAAAEEFANAWYEAFKETGNGIQGLEDTFDNFMDNVVKKQLLYRGTEKILEPLLKMIDDAVADTVLTKNEMSSIMDKFNSDTKISLDNLYKGIVSSLGGIPNKTEGLSQLQQGIQAVTELTAQAIEAYLNSIRFFSSQQSSDIFAIRGMLEAYIGGSESPMLIELRSQTSIMSKISNFIDSMMVAGKSVYGGYALKVVM